MLYNVKKLYYSDGIVDTRIYGHSIEYQNDKSVRIDDELENRQRNFKDEEIRQLNQKRSLARTKQSIYELCRNTEWEWFVTLTFNSEKINRYDYDEVTKKLSKWLNHLRTKNRQLKYIFVPEKHKDGAFHFHGLVSGLKDAKIEDSGHKDKGETIYNLNSYRFGYSTMTKVRDNTAVLHYILKYITKEVCAASEGRRRYWASKNLERPKIVVEFLNPDDQCYMWQELADSAVYVNEIRNSFNEVLYLQNKLSEIAIDGTEEIC